MSEELKHCGLCLECLELISDLAFAFQMYLKDQDGYLKANIDNLKSIANAAEKLYLENSKPNKETFSALNKIMSKCYKLSISSEEAQS